MGSVVWLVSAQPATATATLAAFQYHPMTQYLGWTSGAITIALLIVQNLTASVLNLAAV